MRIDKSIFKKVVVFGSALLLSCGLLSSQVNSHVVNAAEGGAGSSSAGGIGTSWGTATQGRPSIYGDSVGVRIYIVPADIVPLDGVISDSFTHLEKYKGFAVYELSDRGDSGVSPGYTSQVNGGSRESGNVFIRSGYPSAGIALLSSGKGDNTSPSFSSLTGLSKSYSPWGYMGSSTNFASLENWANSVFSSDRFTEENVNSFLSNYKSILASYGVSDSDYTGAGLPSNYDEWVAEDNQWAVVVEPVILVSNVGGSKVYAISYQEFYGNSTFSYRTYNSASWMDSYFKLMQNFYVEYNSDRRNMVVTTKNTPAETGYGLFWIGDEKVDWASEYHFSSNVVVTYDGDIVAGATDLNTTAKWSTTLTPDYFEPNTVTTVARALARDSMNDLLKITIDNSGTKYTYPMVPVDIDDTETARYMVAGADKDWLDNFIHTGYAVFKVNPQIGETNINQNYALLNLALSNLGVKAYTSRSVLSGGDVNLGSAYTVKMNTAKSALASQFVPTTSTVSTYLSNVDVTDPTSKTSLLVSNVAAYSLKASTLTKYGQVKYVVEQGDYTTIAVQYLIKDKEITSYFVNAKMENGTATSKSNTTKTYSSTTGTAYPTGGTASANTYIIAFPDSEGGAYRFSKNKTGQWLLNTLSGLDISGTAGVSTIKSTLDSKGIDATVVLVGSGNKTVSVGASAMADKTLEGYNVVILEVDEPTVPKVQDSSMALKDYELNYVYPTVLGESGGGLVGVRVNNYILSEHTTFGYNSESHNLMGTGFTKLVIDNSITLSKTGSYGGAMISKNNGLGSYKNIFYYTPTGKFGVESSASKSFSSEEAPDVIINHAVNLTRGLFGDTMSVSSMHPTSASNNVNNFLTTNVGLGLSNKGSISSVAASVTKNSSAVKLPVTKSDTFSWQANRKMTNIESKTCTYTYRVWVSDGYTARSWVDTSYTGSDGKTVSSGYYESYWVDTSYWSNRAGTHQVSVKKIEEPLTNGSDTATYNATETCYKYIPLDRSCGENSAKVVQSVKAEDGIGSTSTNNVITYKSASVGVSSKTLTFYPEVAYRAYRPNVTTTLTSSVSGSASSQITPLTVWMMAEKARSVKPSGLYIISTNGTGNANNIVGESDSDTIASSTAAKALSNAMGGLKVVYAGGNIRLKANTNFQINLAGFLLDLADSSLDGSGVTSEWGSSYNSIVADGSDIKSAWGSTAYKAAEEYETWATNVKNSISVDATLKTTQANGATVKTYSGFATSTGKLNGGTTTAEGIYNIQFKGGSIVKDSAYTALIKAIACRYNSTTSPTSTQLSEAETIFANSKIYDSILDAIESNTDADNNSQTTTFSSGKKWYDEVVRTFVVREYASSSITLPNVLVASKIDITAGPTEDASNVANNFATGFYGKWYLTVYLNEVPSSFGSGTVFVPTSAAVNTTGNLGAANNTSTVLSNRVYINGADFIISGNTSSMGR